MCSCNHEEADTRILVHVKDALDKGEEVSLFALLTQMFLLF